MIVSEVPTVGLFGSLTCTFSNLHRLACAPQFHRVSDFAAAECCGTCDNHRHRLDGADRISYGYAGERRNGENRKGKWKWK